MTLRLELALPAEQAAGLARLPALKAPGRASRHGLSIVWHDTPAGALAADGLALAERRQGRETLWRLEQLTPAADATTPLGTQAPVLAQAADRAGLGRDLPAELIPVAGFAGSVRRLPLPPALRAAAPDGEDTHIDVLEGVLRAATATGPVCRVALSGPAPAICGLALELADTLALEVPRAWLSAEALGVAGRPVPPRRLGAVALPGDQTLNGALCFACAHLADVIQHYRPQAALGPGDTDAACEPVHQMRVAARRLRSTLKIFARMAACPELDRAQQGLRELGKVLGPARDWDVFVTGTGRAVAEAFADDPAVTRMIAAARRQREKCYGVLRAFLASAAFRQLGITLACLAAAPPWPGHEADDATGPADLRGFAGQALSRQLRRLAKQDADIDELSAEELHAIRLRAKRLRYAAELFAPLWPQREAKRFINRLSMLQDRLGHLNDGAVAAGLMHELGAGGRGFAAGVVQGYVAASGGMGRAKIAKSWRQLRRAEPFWK
jgi:triphosphatase